MARIALFLVVLAACSAVAKPSKAVLSATSAPVIESGLVVRDVYVSNRQLVPEAEKTPEEIVQPQRAIVELTVSAAFDCPVNAFVVDELEGSILGSHGIDRAVTYFVPRLGTERCTPSALRDYVLRVVWRRRTDVSWTIVVTPYTGPSHRVEDTGLFALAFDGHTESRRPTPKAIPITTEVWSLTNTPAIDKIDVRRDGGDIVLTLDAEDGNACETNYAQWQLHALTSHAGDAAYVWATIVRHRDDAHCGERFLATPLKLERRFPVPKHARTISVAIPNIGDDDLPVFRKTL